MGARALFGIEPLTGQSLRVLIAAPPRRYWPFTSEGDNYLLQQALPHLAVVLLHEGGIEVKVLDCMPLRMGWKTLAQEVRDFRPHIVAIGENHALYANEALRFVALAKEMVPAAKIIVGGGHFASLHHVYLGKYSIDVDFPAFHPLTPVPGTLFFDDALAQG
jgi:hypothetical protein